MLDVLEDFMVLRGIPYARLDGSTNRVRRTFDIKLVGISLWQFDILSLDDQSLQFQQENSRKHMFYRRTIKLINGW
jgi:hypothetical protein